MNPRTLALLGCLGLVPAANASDCEYRDQRELDLDASGVTVLEVAAAAGSLEITGEPGLERIVVRGVACASDDDRLDAIRLVERREGDRVVVAAEMPESGSGWFGNSYQRLDLNFRVPARMALEVSDSSGDASIRGVAAASVQDSSGDLDIRDIAGDLSITDSSGDIDVRGVGGGLRIPSDSSGDIEVAGVEGDVVIEHDSSGDIELREVRGSARVEVDSSGSIDFADIDGDAFVGTDSSGDITATRIGRDFTVQRDGSGSIRHRDVAGTVDVPDDD